MKTVYRTTYRKVCTYAGNDILEKLTESEQAVLDRKRRNRKRKEDRQATISAYVFCALAGAVFFVMPVISILMAGIK